MRTAAVVCNALLFAITGVIILTEGLPSKTHYLALTLLMLLVPLLSAVVLVHERTAPQGPTLTNRATVACNLALLGASCWAAVAQYPYPEGTSVIPFTVLAVCTPLLSLLALLGGGRRTMRGGERPGEV